jgi:hypothetical protein
MIPLDLGTVRIEGVVFWFFVGLLGKDEREEHGRKNWRRWRNRKYIYLRECWRAVMYIGCWWN